MVQFQRLAADGFEQIEKRMATSVNETKECRILTSLRERRSVYSGLPAF